MTELNLNSLVLNDINVEAITNDDKTGIFDKLMSSVNDNINQQFTDGRITNSDYANVYLGSLQTVLQQSIQFALQEQLSEAQISNILKDNDLKEEQQRGLYAERVLKDKQAAKLGLDNVMQLSETARASDVNFKYTPNYIDSGA
jgi:hypothetical protein